MTALLLLTTLLQTSVASSTAPTSARLPAPVVDADFYDDAAPAKIELGRLLFFDKILSGNRNIACATCHHPALGTSDDQALGLGEGASGLGRERRAGRGDRTAVHARLPRNSPALFNLGAKEFTRLFYDGRVEVDTHGYFASGFINPARWKLPTGLDNVLAAQAMFPVTSPDEMAGQVNENPVANAASRRHFAGRQGVWELLAQRLRATPAYVSLFRKAFPDQVADASSIRFVHAANAIAAFEATAFRTSASAFDRFLGGDKGALDASQRAGMDLFYGAAGCAGCHAGAFQTDHEFHAIAVPQIGPGKGDGFDSDYWRDTGVRAFVEDFGRGRVTSRAADNYKFRTPSLRNVALTGPWGHSGAFTDLRAVVVHHADPARSLESYRLSPGVLTSLPVVLETQMAGSTIRHAPISGSRLRAFRRKDGFVQQSARLRGRIGAANGLAPVALSARQIDQLVAFLTSLTDERARNLDRLVPKSVPSGLPVEEE
jgi:cytochrome c peroxidase